jgi:SAM-dependent methyltransferase
MCNPACIEFGRRNLLEPEIRGKFVLEVGSYDVNGSMRPFVMPFGPARYVGVDVEHGPGVDEICDATRIRERFGESSVDVLISTELLEHVPDWREVVRNFKGVLKSGGTLLITTRSRGFHYHGYPYDFWRYEIPDFQFIFQDFDILALETDPVAPGVLLKARKRDVPGRRETDTRGHALYSIVVGRRTLAVSWFDIAMCRVRERLKTLLWDGLVMASRPVPRRTRRWLKTAATGLLARSKKA